MSSLADVRAYIETRVAAAYPGITCVFENTLETPPPVPYVICLISYPSTTEPVLCRDESMIENLSGNLQISCYAERGKGMKPLEAMGVQGMVLMNRMYEWDAPVKVRCGQISGPTPILAGTEPYGLVTISCPFNARVPGSGTTFAVTTRDVDLTNPTRQKAVKGKANTKEVGLVTPVNGMTTQEDANKFFDKRLSDLEVTHDDKRGHDSGTY